MIVCAGKNEYIKGATPVGVGLLESAINLQKLLIKELPKEIIFIGSAGSYGGYKIFDIVESCKASQIESSFLYNISYTPLDNIISLDVSCETNPLVNSSNYITADKKLSDKFLKQSCELENMEFFSILYIAKIYKIEAKGIFVVTNYCYKNAHKEFIQNHKEAKKIMESIVGKL